MKRVLLESSTFVVSLFCVWAIRKLAYRFNWVAQPRKDRWHQKPVALYGGVGMFIPFLGAALFILSRSDNLETFRVLLSILSGATGVFFLGLFDDIKNFRPATKLIGQVVAASLPISTGLLLGVTPWYLINVILTYFWFIGIINAVNMIDNMDGLSSGVVMISTLSIIAILIHSYGLHTVNASLHVAVVFLCSVAGFWVFNRHPASIFMGDSGSLFLGYILAAIAIPGKLNGFLGTSSSIFALFLPVTIIAIPIFDTAFVTVLRKLHGRPASLGGRDHSSHRLVGLGFSEKKSVLILQALALAGGGIAFLMVKRPADSIALAALYIVLLCLIGIYLGRVKVYPEPDTAEREPGWTPLVSQLLYKRHAGEVILDIVLIAVSYYIAYLLRFERVAGGDAQNYVQSLPIVVASCMAGFFLQGIYRGIWHLISIDDMGKYIKGIALGTGASMLLIVVCYRFQWYSRTVFVIFSGLLFLLMVGSRLSFRILENIIRRERSRSDKINVLIYGAGQAGRLLLEESLRNPLYTGYRVIGFIDDDIAKWNRSISGVKIFGKEAFLDYGDPGVKELWISSFQIDEGNIVSLLKHLNNSVKVKRFRLTMETFARF
ncbi:MAG TPA: hypothetical protein VF790_07500 [Dissulfurispiraceae bacterium]